jgi:hypothetical protein
MRLGMSEKLAPSGALISALKTSLSGEGAQAFSYLVLYTSFGVVRGRTGLAFLHGLTGSEAQDGGLGAAAEMIEICDASVEHYSNHLPTITFDRLHVRLTDVRGFALVGSSGQG